MIAPPTLRDLFRLLWSDLKSKLFGKKSSQGPEHESDYLFVKLEDERARVNELRKSLASLIPYNDCACVDEYCLQCNAFDDACALLER